MHRCYSLYVHFPQNTLSIYVASQILLGWWLSKEKQRTSVKRLVVSWCPWHYQHMSLIPLFPVCYQLHWPLTGAHHNRTVIHRCWIFWLQLCEVQPGHPHWCKCLSGFHYVATDKKGVRQALKFHLMRHTCPHCKCCSDAEYVGEGNMVARQLHCCHSTSYFYPYTLEKWLHLPTLICTNV